MSSAITVGLIVIFRFEMLFSRSLSLAGHKMLSILDSLVENLESYLLMGVFQSISRIIFKGKPHRIPSLPISQDPPSSHLT